MSRYVDYEHHAQRYHQGRSLQTEVLERWGAVVRPHLPVPQAPPLRVLDLGAGTGIFARIWPTWASATVVAVEPATAMIQEGRDSAPYVQGVAEHLPVEADSNDVVWISTAVHHFADIGRAVAEIDRVLQPSGKVLIRSHVTGRSVLPWEAAFPASSWARAQARFPDLEWYARTFAPCGFRIDHVENVAEETGTFEQAADWIERMRHVDSMFTALTDDEVAAGVEVLRSEPDRPAQVQLTLVVLARH